MSKYLIRLRPTGKFFFGGYMTFQLGTEKDGKYKDHNERYSSYILHSNHFSQQTSLLGMLRFLLLSNDDSIFNQETKQIRQEQSDAVAKLIGCSSFCVGKENDFGVIKSISPCFLQIKTEDSWSSLFPTPMDYNLEVCFAQDCGAIINGKLKKIPMIPGYDPKKSDERPAFWNDKIKKKLSDIFMEDIRIGINKDYSGVTKDDAFYKQINYCFRHKTSENTDSEYCFAFVADVDFDLTQYSGNMVQLGADSSTFIVEIVKEDITINIPEKYDSTNKVVLLSDSFIKEEDTDDSIYSISETIPFRFLETSIKTEDYHILSNKISKSKRYSLYKRGSVFYFNEEQKKEAFQKKLDSQIEFIKIGYNVYNKKQ